MDVAIGLAVGLVAYGLLLAMLLVLVKPMRRRLFLLARQMMSDPTWEPKDRNEIRSFLLIATSFTAGLLLPVAALGIMLDVLLGRYQPPETTRFDADPRAPQFVRYAALSVLAANPLPVLLSVPALLIAGGAIAVATSSWSLRPLWDAIEDMALRASPRLKADSDPIAA